MDPTRYRPIATPVPDVPGAALGGADWQGAGVPILGIQGLTSNHRLFELLAREVPEHRLVAQDARGRASGFGLPCPEHITTHAHDLARLLDATGIDRAVVVGHSMGGFIALRFAQLHPDRVHGLALVEGGPPVQLPGPLRSGWAVRTAFKRKLPKPGRTWRDFEHLWSWLGRRADGIGALDPDFVRWGFGIDVAEVPGGVRLKQDRAVILEDAVECFTAPWRAEALKALDLPCRFIAAEWGAAKGKKAFYRSDPAPAALAPGTTVTRVPGTDHADVLWHPTTVAAVTGLVAAGR
jgi:pimeloyl-ACP methyl ester carboxylesterase